MAIDKVRLFSNKSAEAAFCLGNSRSFNNKSPIATILCITTTNTRTNIYRTADGASSQSESESDLICIINAGTSLHVSSRHTYSNKVIFGVACGSKIGYVYVGNVGTSGSSSGLTFKWTRGPFFLIGVISTTPPQTIDLYNLDGKINSSTSTSNHPSLNKNGSEMDMSRVIKLITTEDAENSSSSEAAETANSIAASSSSSSSGGSSDGGDIEVTTEFAVNRENTGWLVSPHLAKYITVFNEADVEMAEASKKGFSYTSLRNIFGIPYQFLPSTDCRVGAGWINDIEKAGYEFSEKIVSKLPILYITPGNTSFMGNLNKEQKKNLIADWASGNYGGQGTDMAESSLETMLGEYTGKLYTIYPAYKEYFDYVNPMCRSGAILLDIGGTTFSSDSIVENSIVELDFGYEDAASEVTFTNLNWGVNEGVSYDLAAVEESTEEEEDEDGTVDSTEDSNEPSAEESETGETDEEATEPEPEKYNRDYSDYFKLFESDTDRLTKFQKGLYYGNAIAFYINSDYSFQDSFTNETSESSLSTTINTLSDKAREIQFLLGTAKDAVGEAFDRVDGTLSEIKSQISAIVDKVAGGNTIFTTIANSVKTIVSGGRMQFPQIWANSTFAKQYSINIKLTTPSTDRVSWWLNIYVPLCHLMGLVLPRAEYPNSYTTPFIVKAFYKGMFNIDMGIITEMSFNKGKEGSWTKDGLPTVVDVSFTIQDLYTSMSMTSTKKMFKGFTLQNTAELDYIANLCGINVNEPDQVKMMMLWGAFNITNKVYEFVPNLRIGFDRWISNGIMNAYNNFWT